MSFRLLSFLIMVLSTPLIYRFRKTPYLYFMFFYSGGSLLGYSLYLWHPVSSHTIMMSNIIITTFEIISLPIINSQDKIIIAFSILMAMPSLYNNDGHLMILVTLQYAIVAGIMIMIIYKELKKDGYIRIFLLITVSIYAIMSLSFALFAFNTYWGLMVNIGISVWVLLANIFSLTVGYDARWYNNKEKRELIAQRVLTDFSILSKRELEVAYYIALGHSTELIAATLFISKRTVDFHKNNIKVKLDLHSSSQLMLLAVENREKIRSLLKTAGRFLIKTAV